MGGIIAGNTITKFLETKQISDLKEYQKIWIDKFGKEFEKQIMARKLLHRLDNNSIDKIFSQITPDIIKEISEKDDFDFHTSSIIKMLGLKNSVSVAQTIIGGEIKKLLHS
jgi:flavin-dependent dehydrogenase